MTEKCKECKKHEPLIQDMEVTIRVPEGYHRVLRMHVCIACARRAIAVPKLPK